MPVRAHVTACYKFKPKRYLNKNGGLVPDPLRLRPGRRLGQVLWLSYKERTVDALAPTGDEGRGKLR
jgi:hypothetical protein